MVQRKRVGVPQQTPRTVRKFPDIKPEQLPPPPDVPAIRMRAVQVALWRRLRRSLQTLGIAAISFIGLIAVVATSDTGQGFPAFAAVVLGWIGSVTLLLGGIGSIRTARIAWRLRRSPWRLYSVEQVSIGREVSTRMTIVDGKIRYPVSIYHSKRTETLRGMIRLDIWFVGDPTKRGILTPAGGGELLWTHPVRVRPIKVRSAKQVKPRKIKPMDPEKARRLAAKRAAQSAKAAERAKAYAAKQAAKQKANAKKPQKPVRQPKLPKIRGAQKIRFK